jgi:hypothetical protein
LGLDCFGVPELSCQAKTPQKNVGRARLRADLVTQDHDDGAP